MPLFTGLDLAQLRPNDSNGKEQTRHVSMSRAMHYFHANLPNASEADDPDGAFADLFPTMPPIIDSSGTQRSASLTSEILGETCYNCHPGKRTKCLRGAMENGGMVCQDCHGQGTQVGNDFTADFPNIPWECPPRLACAMGERARVPVVSCGRCIASRVSGAIRRNSATALINPSDKAGNADNLRLLQAYAISDHKFNGGGDNLALSNFSELALRV